MRAFSIWFCLLDEDHHQGRGWPGGHQGLIDRCPELRGDRLSFLCRNGRVGFESIEARPVT
jgi:hypothetical protein